MGTRGIVGYVVDGQEKLSYNHFDSYPSGHGMLVLKELRELLAGGVDPLRERVRAVTLVDGQEAPTEEQVAAVREVVPEWSVRSDDWYDVLHEQQGSIGLPLTTGFMTDDHGFATNSLFCEWGYVVDLDAETFEVYRGFQTKPPTEGRWATPEAIAAEQAAHDAWVAEGRSVGNRYYAVQRVGCWPLGGGLPDDDELLALEKAAYDDEDDD